MPKKTIILTLMVVFTIIIFSQLNATQLFNVNPTSHDFGFIYLNSESVSHTFTLTNTGNHPLWLVVSLTETSNDFTLSENTHIPIPVNISGNAIFTASFKPISQGPKYAIIEIKEYGSRFQAEQSLIKNVNLNDRKGIKAKTAYEDIKARDTIQVSLHGEGYLNDLNIFYPPTNLTATLVNEEVYLSWRLPEMGSKVYTRLINSFEIYRNAELLNNNVTQTFFTDDTVENNTSYSYYVKAIYINPDGVSIPSNIATLHTTFPPREIQSHFEGSDVVLNWFEPTGGGADGYNVYRDETKLNEDIVIPPTFTDMSTISGTTYTYKVRAVYSNIESEAIQVTLITPIFDPPLNLTAVAMNSYIRLDWNIPEISSFAILDGYKVYRNGIVIKNFESELFYDDYGVAVNVLYTYHVTAIYSEPSGESLPSNIVSVMLIEAPPPVGLVAEVEDGFVHLSWNLPGTERTSALFTERIDLVGFNVYRDGQPIAINVNETQFIDNSIANINSYSYYVTALYINPTAESEPSNTVDLTVRYPVRNLTATLVGYDVWLVWDFPLNGGTNIYNVYRNGIKINTTSIANLLYLDDNTTPGALNNYQVKAIYSGIESNPVNISITIPFYNSPQNLSATTLGNDIHLKWFEPENMHDFEELMGYKIYRNDYLLTEKYITETIFADFNLSIDTKYTYQVVSVFFENVSQPALVEAIIPIFNPPKDLKAVVEDAFIRPDVVNLSWKEPDTQNYGNLLGFRLYRNEDVIQENIPAHTLEYIDEEVFFYTEYTYYVKALWGGEIEGESESSNIVSITLDPASDGEGNILPMITQLRGNRPNPFNPETVIMFSTAAGSIVSIDIYNIRGQKVRNLLAEYKERGEHSVVWNGQDETGQTVGSGIYFYVMKSEDFVSVRKMVLLK